MKRLAFIFSIWGGIALLFLAWHHIPLLHGYSNFELKVGDIYEYKNYSDDNPFTEDKEPLRVTVTAIQGKYYQYVFDKSDIKGGYFHGDEIRKLWYFNRKFIDNDPQIKELMKELGEQ